MVVYMGIIYDLANVIVIETGTGVIIIDTLGTIESAQRFLNDFKSKIYAHKLLNIETIILTHNHPDHIGGLYAFVNYSENKSKPNIYAHIKCLQAWKLQYVDLKQGMMKRNARQFGVLSKHFIPKQICKDKNLFIPGGIFTQFGTRSPIPFNDIIYIKNKQETLHIGGKIGDIKLFHSPGETDDMLLTWIPTLKMLCPGDNVYSAYPNLYAIRGTVMRKVDEWIESLDLMRYLPIKYLCGGHSKPIIGAKKIYSILTLYRDSVAFIHDQTLRLINLEYELEDIIHIIGDMMPMKLKTGKRYEFYGTIEWGIRTIYNQYMGWFSGDVSELYPATKKQRGHALDLLLFDFNGRNVDELCQYIENDILVKVWRNEDRLNRNNDIVIFEKERYCLEIITSLLRTLKYKNNQMLNNLRWKIIKKAAGRSISSNGRNYLISMWLEEQFKLDPLGRNYFKNNDSLSGVSHKTFYENIPIDWYMKSLQNKINPKKCIQRNDNNNENYIHCEVVVKFKDSDLFYDLQIRNGGVLEVRKISNMDANKNYKDEIEKRSDIIFEMDEIMWKTNKCNDFDLVVKGNENDVKNFWNYFQNDIKSKL